MSGLMTRPTDNEQVRLGVVHLREVPMVNIQTTSCSAVLTRAATRRDEPGLHSATEPTAVLRLIFALVVRVRRASHANTTTPAWVVGELQAAQLCGFAHLRRPRRCDLLRHLWTCYASGVGALPARHRVRHQLASCCGSLVLPLPAGSAQDSSCALWVSALRTGNLLGWHGEILS